MIKSVYGQNLKSSMDRFIGIVKPERRRVWQNLKSSMDRFIAYPTLELNQIL